MPHDVCPGLPLPCGRAALRVGLPKRLSQNLQRAGRQLAQRFSIRYEEAQPWTIEEYVEALITLHGQRWRARAETGVLAEGVTQTFHRKVARELLDQGRLRYFGLRVEGRLRAVLLVLVDRQRAYYYLSGFDPALAAYSPGGLVLAYALDSLCDEGIQYFDFLRGAEAYKHRWGADDKPTYRLTLRPSPA